MLTVQMSRVLVLLCLALEITVSSAGKLVVCYFPNWAPIKRTSTARLTIDHIDPSLCTHILYAFAGIDDVKLTLKPTSDRDEGPSGFYSQFAQLKRRSPKTALMLSIGGATANNTHFTNIVSSTKGSQIIFARNVIRYARKRNFDGIDIDWEYPSLDTKRQFTQFLETLRQVFDDEILGANQARLQLSAAVGVGQDRIDTSYEVPDMSRLLDFISIMAYDYHSAEQALTGFNSPLWSRTQINERFSSANCQNSSVSEWLEAGLSANKLVLGMAAFGNSFTLSNSSQNSVGSSVSAMGEQGPYTQTKGMLAYYEVCERQNDGDLPVNWDATQQVPYIFWEDQWVGYDNPNSIATKAQFIKDMDLAGAMLWSLDLDDFSGDHCHDGSYPLTRKIREILIGDSLGTTENHTNPPTQTKPSTKPNRLRAQPRSKTSGSLPNVVVVTSNRASVSLNYMSYTIVFILIFTIVLLTL